MVTEQEKAAILHAISGIFIALREGKLQACAFPPDATSQNEVDRRKVLIPARFWRGLMDHEMARIFQRPDEQSLDAGLCVRLWECLRRKGQPPTGLALAVRGSDLRRMWPGLKDWPG